MFRPLESAFTSCTLTVPRQQSGKKPCRYLLEGKKGGGQRPPQQIGDPMKRPQLTAAACSFGMFQRYQKASSSPNASSLGKDHLLQEHPTHTELVQAVHDSTSNYPNIRVNRGSKIHKRRPQATQSHKDCLSHSKLFLNLLTSQAPTHTNPALG